MENSLNKLKQLKKVDAPDYLWTRIQQKIENSQEMLVSKPFVIFGLTSVATTIVLFMFVLKLNSNSRDTNSVANEIAPNQQLYTSYE